MSFAYGLAVYMLILFFTFEQDGRPIGQAMLKRLKNLLALFVAAVLYFTLVYHLTKLYGAKNAAVEAFLLIDGGLYTAIFWVGWVLIGGLLPLAVLYHPELSKRRNWVAAACAATIIGGFAAMYVIIIGGQAYPLEMFPGYTVVEFGAPGDIGGSVAPYAPSLPELLLGLGGIAVALLITAVGVRVLQFLPESLADRDVDPHASAVRAG
jgi:molybdopterin-containing oxidoreductase family membrane subunit